MDEVQPNTTKPISDDQELAKVLAGVSKDADSLGFEETPAAPATTTPEPETTPPAPSTEVKPESEPKSTPPFANSVTPPSEITPPSTENGDLDNIKKDALTELRPLVDKLDLSPDEKFDIYLLLLRSSDDKTLIAPAHTAAKEITDETRRAQALLDVIKEIDYLSAPPENPAEQNA